MNNDAARPNEQPDGYISLVVHLWVGDQGRLIRGTIEDVHTGARLPFDLSALAQFLQTTLTHVPGGQLETTLDGPSSGELVDTSNRQGRDGP